jgi:hypothetical protein
MTEHHDEEDPAVNDLAALRAQFPRWDITEHGFEAAAGPGGLTLVARRDGFEPVIALTANGLRRNIREAVKAGRMQE